MKLNDILFDKYVYTWYNVYETNYWLNDIATNNYTTVINSAMYSWNHTASSPGVRTPIWFEPVASSSYSVMDIYVFSESFALANGSTVFFGTYYDHSSYIDPLESDWRWCQIKVYAGNFNSNTLRSLAEGVTFKSVVAHEMGHVFGLYENPEDNTSIMCQSYNRGINVTGPNADDCRGINAIY